MPFTPDEVELKEFTTSIRGYEKDEVQAFLRAVADDFRRLERRGRQAWEEDPLEELRQLTHGASDEQVPPSGDTTESPAAASSNVRAPLTWRAELDRAVIRADERIGRWIEDQRSKLIENLNVVLAQVHERQKREAESLETWREAERTRLERDFATEEAAFHNRLLDELMAFEEQLLLRLSEQEERLARWWDEAEEIANRRLADAASLPLTEAEQTSA